MKKNKKLQRTKIVFEEYYVVHKSLLEELEKEFFKLKMNIVSENLVDDPAMKILGKIGRLMNEVLNKKEKNDKITG